MALKTRKFANVTTEGGMLPVDLLSRIYAIDSALPGISAPDYHLASGDKLTDAISRSWSALRARWESFKAEREKFGDEDRGTSATRERWLLPLFSELGYGRLMVTKAEEIEGRVYPISHGWHRSPIHLVSASVSLDEKRAGVAGASRSSPHSLVQEYLNRTSKKLWGFVTNGLTFRILRDNISLTRQSYVEFDLEGIFDSEAFADFSLLWLLCHQSRVEAEKPEECWLEQWSCLAQKEGTRALDQLRSGVERAISALGNGFISERRNHALRENLRSGNLSKAELYRELLRIIYRLIFIFVAEDRELLLLPDADRKARERYQRFYSTARLRDMAAKVRGGHHIDQYQVLKLVFGSLGSSAGAPELAIGPLGSFLWSPQATPNLDSCELSNAALLDSIRALTTIVDGSSRRFVDYKNLGSEELGSIYESLLELHPELDIEAGSFELRTAQGNERKTTGSYYTPSSLINCLLDSALEPVVAEALKIDRSEKSILKLKVCDPACGSGHFLIGAAHRLAKHLARVRTGEDEPPPQATRRAMRDVVGHCIYGVDINPMAVELCKVSLWLDALEPGRPLSFLEHRIQCGNSLLGVTPALLEKGIPDEAFEPIEGDDKRVCSGLKKQNKKEHEARAGRQTTMFDVEGFEAWNRLGNIQAFITTLDDIDDSSIEGIQKKQALYEEQVKGKSYLFSRFWADAWCAAFVWNRNSQQEEFITEEVFRRIEKNPHSVSPSLQDEVRRIATEYKFFHWHLAFPGVFRVPKRGETPDNREMGWSGGFDVVLGNPPWERIKIQEKEWFAERSPLIASAPNAAARSKMIAALKESDPSLYKAFGAELRRAEGESHYIRSSGRYPLCGRGDVNTYSIFAESAGAIIRTDRAGAGIIVPSGVATDDTTKFYFQNIVESGRLVSLYDFENRNAIFMGVHRSFKFTLLTLGSPRPGREGKFAFFLHETGQLLEQGRVFNLSAADIQLVNPNTKTCPIFLSERDAEITKRIYERVPVLIREGDPDGNPWGITFRAMFHMSNDSHLFHNRNQLDEQGFQLRGNIFEKGKERYLPLYEAKMIHQFDHRWATYDGEDARDVTEQEKQNPNFEPLPRYWVHESEVNKAIPESWDKPWLMGWRDICRSTDERTVIASLVPRVGVGDKFLLLNSSEHGQRPLCLLANLNSLAFDYVARQKVGGTSLKYFTMKQLPVLLPTIYSEVQANDGGEIGTEIETLVTNLLYSSSGMNVIASANKLRPASPQWKAEDRILNRARLDALYFGLYQLTRSEVEFILDQFPVLRRKENKALGEYRTKRLILEYFDTISGVYKLKATVARAAAVAP